MDSFLVAHPFSHPLNLCHWEDHCLPDPLLGAEDTENQIPVLSNPTSQM